MCSSTIGSCLCVSLQLSKPCFQTCLIYECLLCQVQRTIMYQGYSSTVSTSMMSKTTIKTTVMTIHSELLLSSRCFGRKMVPGAVASYAHTSNLTTMKCRVFGKEAEFSEVGSGKLKDGRGFSVPSNYCTQVKWLCETTLEFKFALRLLMRPFLDQISS